jgi:hypothetical protein
MSRIDGDCWLRCGAALAQLSLHRSRRTHPGLIGAFLLCVIFAVSLTGCGSSDSVGSLLVDPAHYSVMHCKDLVAQRNSLISREEELRKLQAKASEGTGGTIIGKMAYGSDYETAVTEQKIVEREAREKNCEIVPTYQSDQTIR